MMRFYPLPALLLFGLGLVVLAPAPLLGAESVPLLREAQLASAQGLRQKAVDLLSKAIAADPLNATAYFQRAQLLGKLGQHLHAAADFSQALQLSAPPGMEAAAYQERGSEYLKLGRFTEAMADFDKAIALTPAQSPHSWQRGLACYYAGRYQEGRLQFNVHQRVNPQDVENSAWEFLCTARVRGLETARNNLLPVSEDSRVPMSQIYQLFNGRATPEEVLQAATNSPVSAREIKSRLFYARFYIGLFYEAIGNGFSARSYIQKAAEEAPTDDYMADIARMHAAQFRSLPLYPPVKPSLFQTRGGLDNYFSKVRDGKSVKVAFLGGSITAADGWRSQVFAWLQEEHEKEKVLQINAAIGGTGSDLGIYRFEQDVLRHKPDLIFVEFAVNDAGAPVENIWRAFDGLVRKAWETDPTIDFCFVYTFRTGFESELNRELSPRSIAAQELVADYYRIPSINLALHMTELARQKTLIFVPGGAEKLPDSVTLFSQDGVHPLPEAHSLYAQVIMTGLQQFSEDPHPGAHPLPTPFIADTWSKARLVPLSQSMLSAGWRRLTNDLGQRFAKELPQLWEASTPGETISFQFKGTAVKGYDLLGPDAGQLLITVDGKTQSPVARFDSFSTYHRLGSFTIAEGLPDGVHTVQIKIDSREPDRSAVLNKEKNKPGFSPEKYRGTQVRMGSIMMLGEEMRGER